MSRTFGSVLYHEGMILCWRLLLEKDSSCPVDSKNGPTFKDPIIGLGDTSLNVGQLGIYENK